MTPEQRASELMDRWEPYTSGDWIEKAIVVAICAAVAEEREACAKLAEVTFDEGMLYEGSRDGGEIIAAVIRERAKP